MITLSTQTAKDKDEETGEERINLVVNGTVLLKSSVHMHKDQYN
jgi:hypothetical protein